MPAPSSRAGRVAEVRTDEGLHVTVIGTPAGPDPSGGDRATSIDRTYEVGVRYEFDPRNSTSPYEDNACTATQALTTILAVLLGGAILGIVGALIAIPIAAATVLLLNEVLYPRLDHA